MDQEKRMEDKSNPTDLDPAEGLAIISEQRHQLHRTGPDGRILFGAWGLAWIVGYFVLWESDRRSSGGPVGWAFVAYAALLVAAMVITIVHTSTRIHGVRGPSARSGAMYGWCWVLGFLAYGFILGGLGRMGVSGAIIAMVANAGACLIVGLLYMVAGAMWQDMPTFVLGLWMLVVGSAVTLIDAPASYLVMALLGGGGLLVLAGIDHAIRHRHTPATSKTAAVRP